jgi:hypothetical protein
MDSEEIRRLVAAAGFVFRGNIRHEWRGEAPAVPAEAGEIVATRIEQVLRSTQVLRGVAGQTALVISGHAGTLRQQHGVIVFAECVSLGRQLLLREIGYVEATKVASHQVAEAIREADERPLRERLAGADLVVTGEVAESQPTESAKKPKSEHDPIWWIARVAVKSVLKGRKPAGKVDVLFANSTDIAWFESPKLHPGTSGILLLKHLQQGEVPKDVPRTAYQATDPRDLLPIERLAEVERWLGEDRGGQ